MRVAYLPLLLSLAITASSCKLGRKATANTTGIPGKDIPSIEKAVNANLFDFDYLRIRSRTNATMNGEQIPQLVVNIRMKRDSVIWMSATVFGGLEAARLLITEDSLHVLNQLEKTYTGRPLSDLQQYLSASLTVRQLQDLLLGNPVIGYRDAVSDMQNDSIVVLKKLGNIALTEFFHQSVAKIAHLELSNIKEQAEGDVYYPAFQQIETKSLPEKVLIFVNTPQNNASAEFEYNEISKEKYLDFPFRIPDSYKRN